MQIGKLALKITCSILCVTAWIPATARASNHLPPATDSVVPSRILEAVDDTKRVNLHGNTHPMAQSQYETGRVEPGLAMERILLVLQRSPQQEEALAAFNERQYDPKSPDFHHWLHAAEFGRLYGPSDADLAAVTSWLQNHGFQIQDVNKGRTLIQFAGTAAQVETAFQVEMHRYNVHGETHIANDRDPSIPEALAPVVSGIASLHDFFSKPQHAMGKNVWIDRKTGKKTPVETQPVGPEKAGTTDHPQTIDPAASGRAPQPQLTYSANSDTYEDLTPYDFATIYNILPLWTASTPINGTGVNIAISGVSDVYSSDVKNFRASFGLPAMTLQTIHNGTDPGADKGPGQGENSLDVEMAGATAPGAQIILVVSGNTSTTSGDMLSDEYIIDNETAPIMSASYGSCELNLGTAGNKSFNTIWQQGATEGISIFESAGDQGSAGCSNSDTAGPNADKYGLEVNGLASSPYVTAVGGTDFTWSFVNNGTQDYWNSTNGTHMETAKGIMPEVPWNSTCTNPLLVPLFGASNSEQLCNGLLTYDNAFFDGLVVITGGSGGTSHCTQPTGTTASTCAGGYAKPSWQTGFGSSSSHRDLPDVSLFASDGFPSTVDGSAILMCDSVSAGTCDYTSTSGIEAQQVGGTSASSPLWAGIMALIVQQTNSNQGLANPVLYKLYANQVAAGTACDSSTVTNGNTCVFYDVTQGTNAQVCFTGDPNCTTNTSGDQLGILGGFAAATGYDDATGLGTVNVANLVNSWSSATGGATTVTLSPTTLTFASTSQGATSAAQTVTIQNTGSSSVSLTSETVTGTDASSFPISANTCGSSLASKASCTVSIEFNPAATGTLTASLSVADNASGSPQNISLTGTGAVIVTPPTYTLSASAVTVSPGTNGTSTITATGAGGYTGSITLSSCTVTTSPSGATDPPSCSVGSPITIAAGATSASSTVTITTTGTTASLVVPRLNNHNPARRWKEAGELALAGLLLFGIPARRRSWKALLSVLLLFACLGVLSGCGSGGSGNNGGGGNSGTTAGAYTLTLNGTDANGLKQTTTIALNVN